ncbi:MAG TPA: amidohydrolase [Candidatus Limnocylindrales bacterium]|nr:amidohydrolase [Candidatus Limnocylindrales bacterium]
MDGSSGAPNLILHGGRVRTMTPAAGRGRGAPGASTAIAIGGDRIVGLGQDGDMLALRGPRTRVVDLRGRTVLPGFTDAHTHPVSGGLRHVECDLDRFDTEADHLAAVAAYAAAHPDLEWIVGDGWSMSTFPGGIPRREALDAVVPDRPVLLTNRDGHGAWVNSRALELAGITAATPDPPAGRIERDPDGTPVGTLQETAIELVRRLVPDHGQSVFEQALLDAQAELHALGITGWQDANVPPRLLAAYRAIAGRGELTARVVLSLSTNEFDRYGEESDPFGGIDAIGAARDVVAAETVAEGPGRPGAGRLAATAVKFFVDGIIESRTAAMLDPYLGTGGEPDGGTGTLNFDPGVLRSLAVDLDARGFQLHFHAIGDRGVRESLDAIEAARLANGARDGRHHIAHIQVIHPSDVPRFRALDVVANGQPLWAVHESQMDELTIPILGPERTAWQYPFGSLLRAGARLAFGSDWTVSTADPFPQLEVAVRRVWPENEAGEAFLPSERLSLDDALAAFTVGSAFVNRQDEAGWLGVGRLADVVVLDRDLEGIDLGRAGALAATKVVATIVGGELVHEAPALEG